MLHNSLQLFEAVLEKNTGAQPMVLPMYGVIIESSAVYALSCIEKYLRENYTKADRLNSTFHQNFGKVAEASEKQLFAEQLVHYITTYGFASLGVYDDSTVFVPRELPIFESKGYQGCVRS